MKINVSRSDKRKLTCLILVGFICVLQYMQLDLSYMSLTKFLSHGPRAHLFCCLFNLLVILFFMLCTMRLHVACMISSVFFFILSIVNHYVLLYRGEPFSLTLLPSIRTAWNVLDRYRFTPDRFVLFSVLCLAAEIGISAMIKKIYPEKQRFLKRRFAVYFFAFSLLSVSTILTNVYVYQHKNTRFDPKDRGYATFLIQDIIVSIKTRVVMPAEYSTAELEKKADRLNAVPEKTEIYPDIILILNETFYDLNTYTDIETDEPYLKEYSELTNAVTGYAISPYASGGTNDSEFELLTGYSSLLFNQKAPFVIFSPFDHVNNIARYLDSLGYSTQAAHPCDPLNYNRQKVYPELKFDTVRFYDDFTDHDRYGNRVETDSANYQDLIRWYEAAGDGPRFLYLLTYQNHGGYEQNESGLDTVHVKEDLGNLTGQVNEYLTSIRMSDDALKELLSYFNRVDRPVIICMVGDHSPAFLLQLPKSNGTSEKEKRLLAQEVPFLIWGNASFGEIKKEEDRLLGMTDLVPQMLDVAGLPLSPFYSCMLDLSRSVPIRLRNGYYQTADGKEGRLEPSDELFDEISLPLYIGYADLSDESDRWDFLFTPPEQP